MKILASQYLKDLIYFDLLTYDFTSFYVSGIDFRGRNACLDLQKVYNKDMSNGDYSEVTFLNYDMTRVNIEKSIFTNDFINCYQENMLKLKRTKENKFNTKKGLYKRIDFNGSNNSKIR